MTTERVEVWDNGVLVAVEERPAAPEPEQPTVEQLTAQVAELQAALAVLLRGA